MTNTNITEEMIRKAAAALKKGTVDNADMGTGYWGKQAEVALRAALAGYTVTRLPDADGVDDGVYVWALPSGEVQASQGAGEGLIYEAHGDYLLPDEGEQYGAVLIAAARTARRLASESSGGETHG